LIDSVGPYDQTVQRIVLMKIMNDIHA
jgi:hypothetical protein